jgi:alcohol dehydrogenase (NADP+)
MPLIGFGTYKVSKVDSIGSALEAGYRHFDCASVYGNEALVGEGLHPFISGGKRSELFITSKVWNDAHRPDALRASCEKSIADLQCQYLDLYLMHWPDAWEPGSGTPGKPDTTVSIQQTWQAMESLVDAGLVKHIGVSNFSLKQVEEVLEHARIKPVVNQIELHPLLAQRKLVGVCFRKGVHSVAFSPLGHSAPDLLQNEVVQQVAKQVGKTPAQVCLKWNIQRGVAVIPRSQNPENIRANLEGMFDWALPEDVKAQLDALDCGKRTVNNDWHDWGNPEEGGATKPSSTWAKK